MKNGIFNIIAAVCHGENYAENFKSNTGAGTRYCCIDLLEALCMLLVVSAHGDLMIHNLFNGCLWDYVNYFLRSFQVISVPLFFFANGFLVFGKELNLKKHIRGMIRLMLLTVFWGIITLIFLMPAKGEYLNPKEFILALWHWKMGWVNHLWFMGALIVIHVFFPLLKLAFDKKNSLFIYFLVICFIFTFGNRALNMIASFIKPGSNTNFFNFFNPFRSIYGYTFVYFMLGGIAERYYNVCRNYVVNNKNKVVIRSAAVFLLSCALLTAYGIFISYKTGEVSENIFENFNSVFALISVCCVYFVSLLYNRRCKPVEIVSKNTMGIFFIHIIIISYTRPYLTVLLNMNSFIIYILYGFFVLLASLAAALVIKKIPFLRNTV